MLVDGAFCPVPAARSEVLVKLPGDSSVTTYAGHMVKHTLLRCRFSPAATTGQVRTGREGKTEGRREGGR